MRKSGKSTRYRSIFHVAFMSLTAVPIAGRVGPIHAEPIRILPLGNSITQGESPRKSYRPYLDFLLNDAGYEFDFVGRMQVAHDGATGSGFDCDHEGHYGKRADEVLLEVDSIVAGFSPDIVLCHLGTNDLVASGQSREDLARATLNDIENIIETFRASFPEIVFVVARIIPCSPEDHRETFQTMNAMIDATWARDRSTATSPVYIADHYDGFDPGSDLCDRWHPNESGSRKMASTWFAVLEPILAEWRETHNRMHARQPAPATHRTANNLLKLPLSPKNHSPAALVFTVLVHNSPREAVDLRGRLVQRLNSRERPR